MYRFILLGVCLGRRKGARDGVGAELFTAAPATQAGVQPQQLVALWLRPFAPGLQPPRRAARARTACAGEHLLSLWVPSWCRKGQV